MDETKELEVKGVPEKQLQMLPERSCQTGKMEYKNVFKSENGAVLEMAIKADCPTQEEMHKTISFIAKSSRKFYLQTAEKINSML